jgi:hypothetical protein
MIPWKRAKIRTASVDPLLSGISIAPLNEGHGFY